MSLIAAFEVVEGLEATMLFDSFFGDDETDLGVITFILVWRLLIVLKVTSCSSSSSDVALDSVEDSEESDAADMGRLGGQQSSVLPSFDRSNCNPEIEEFAPKL